ncbi:eppin-like [Alligator mississippiensis]|uniref:Eppin-like n=1 Tax=Alligator mississippiensis TaxID=8496 RepID=A0A151P8C7_ALLMI|nr:eppin-like [Alligator mississippiensis]
MKSGILLLLLAVPLLLWAKPTPPAEKAGYCSRQPPLGGVFDEEHCSACLKDQSCSNCSSDAKCPGEAKCCPGDCGFTCQAPVKALMASYDVS